MSGITYFQDRVILALKNSIVDQINDYMLDLILGEAKIYLSHDLPLSRNMDGDAIDDVHTLEFLNTINISGLSNHKLRLKVGVPAMLLRNIDQKLGLCNGTTIFKDQIGKFVLEGKVIYGSNIGMKIFIPRLFIKPYDVRIPFKFQQTVFKECWDIFVKCCVFTWSIICCNFKSYFQRWIEDVYNR